MASILIIDDDIVLCSMLFEQLSAAGHHAVQAHTLSDGRSCAADRGFDVVLLDVQLPDGNGLEHIAAFKRTSLEPEVIIITGQGEADGAERAVRSGAWSYIAKPHVLRELDLHLARALQYRRERRKVTKVPVALKRSRIIGSSAAINRCLDRVAAAAGSDVSVLISGDTGTGKELFAKAIHENSRRSQENFIIVDCAALPETLIESTLFGHVKGAFTNADRDHDGLVKHAHRGTLFLDEVGELPPAIQKTFLRLLQEHEYRPVGSTRQQFSDFRLVAATNKNLDEMVAAGIFREDLLFRLKAFTIELPPLKERKEDLRELVSYFMHDICQRYSLEPRASAPIFSTPSPLTTGPAMSVSCRRSWSRLLPTRCSGRPVFPSTCPNRSESCRSGPVSSRSGRPPRPGEPVCRRGAPLRTTAKSTTCSVSAVLRPAMSPRPAASPACRARDSIR